MTSGGIADDDWVAGLARALPELAKVQEPFLREYWEQNAGVRIVYVTDGLANRSFHSTICAIFIR